jgi:hypothetical protein
MTTYAYPGADMIHQAHDDWWCCIPRAGCPLHFAFLQTSGWNSLSLPPAPPQTVNVATKAAGMTCALLLTGSSVHEELLCRPSGANREVFVVVCMKDGCDLTCVRFESESPTAQR